MAIDYGNYAQLYGAKPDLSGLSTAVDKFLNKRKEGIMMQANKMKDDTWGGYQNAFEDVLSADVGGADEGVSWAAKAKNLTSKTAGQALESYKEAARLKGNKVYEMMEKNGQFEPTKFKEMYDSMIVNSMPGIERKLEDFKKSTFMSDGDMRKYLKDNNLQNFMQQYGSDAGPLKELSFDKDTFFGKLGRRFEDDPAGVATQAGFTVGGVLSAPKLAKTVSSGPSKTLSTIESNKLTDVMKKKYGENRRNVFTKQSEKILKEATDTFDKAKKDYLKNYKGKSKSPKFESSKQGKKLLESLKNKKIDPSKINSKVTNSIKSMADKIIKKHGKAKALRLIAKKVGFKGALSMGAKLGLGIIPAGFTQAAAGVLLATDVIFLYNTLKELSDY